MNTPPPPPLPNADKPKLVWHEHLWLGWPMILVFLGGAIGGACGGAAWALNQQLFQKTRHPVLRYVWTGLISVGAIITYFIVAALFLSYFKPDR